ncbi:MAG: GGDEF domain-containing protein [Rubrobacter sp.]|nr:GGDEF domain-containing protein [Rubrobacter sp.]
MTNLQGPLDRLKQQTYVLILFTGLIGSTLALLINELTGTISPFTRGIFVATISFLALQVWLMRSKKFRIEVARGLLYVFLSAIVLSVLFYALYLAPSSALSQISLVSLYLWFPLVYVFIFIAYDGRAALARSGVLYMIVFSVSLPHALATLGSEEPFESFNSLGQLYISTPSLIIVLFFLAKLKDQLRESQIVSERMKVLAQTDVLTGLLNRRYLEHLLEQEIKRSRRYSLPLSFILFDLDDFKCLNDTLGHHAGDTVLLEIARLVEPLLRASDHFGRWGGEEFAIVASQTSLESAQQLADRLRIAIVDRGFGPVRALSASFGVAEYRPGDSKSTLFKRTDMALYHAKDRGKNRVEVVEKETFHGSISHGGWAD